MYLREERRDALLGGGVAPDFEDFNQIVELAMDVTNHTDWILNGQDVGLRLYEDRRGAN